MARVIVILALMFLISAAIFGLTRKAPIGGTGIDADARTTLPLNSANLKPDTGGEFDKANPDVTGKLGRPIATAQEVLTGAVSGAAPAFSSVGVDHRGRALFTGTSSPGDEVSIVHDGKPLGRSRTDSKGQWTVDFKLPTIREDLDLMVTAKRDSGVTAVGPQRALVSPPSRAGGLPRVTLMAAELKAEKAEDAAGTEPQVGIVIQKSFVSADGLAELQGRSDPGAVIKALVAGKLLAEASVGNDGAWVLKLRNETASDVASVRIVLVSKQGQELDSAEYPLKLKAAKPVLADAAPTGDSKPVISNARPQAPGVYVKVRRGDSLWRIAKRHYGDGRKWTRIYKSNRRKLKDPDLIFVGGRLYLPG